MDDHYDSVLSVMRLAAKSTSGGKKYSFGGNPYGKSYWDEICSEFRNKRSRCARRLRVNPGDIEAKLGYEHWNTQLRQRIRKRRDSWRQESANKANAEHKSTRRARYHYRMAMSTRTKNIATVAVSLRDTDGSVKTDPQEVSKIAADHFEALSTPSQNKDFDICHKAEVEKRVKSFGEGAVDPVFDSDIEYREVVNVLKNTPKSQVRWYRQTTVRIVQI